MAAIDADTYRRMAARLRDRVASGQYPSSLVMSRRIGGTTEILRSSRYAVSQSDLRAHVDRALACITQPDAEVIERLKDDDRADIERYERRADEIDRDLAVRIEVALMTGDPKANESIETYETTLGQFLRGDGARWGIGYDDVSGLEVGESETVHDRDHYQRRITRLPDAVVEREAKAS